MATVSIPACTTALLLDIEGTTTPITFVKDILFPYIVEHLEDHLSKHWEEDECKQDVHLLKKQVGDKRRQCVWRKTWLSKHVYYGLSILQKELHFTHCTPAMLLFISSFFLEERINFTIWICAHLDFCFFVFFVSEAKAAEEAGLNVLVVVRPGNMELTDEESAHYNLITSFSQLQLTGRA
uniref:Enolase-phosphatase 1 n=1 Tax=Cyprinodon variegatus TaxID=28743 RepID=A0A3Q2DD24_CYPVA